MRSPWNNGLRLKDGSRERQRLDYDGSGPVGIIPISEYHMTRGQHYTGGANVQRKHFGSGQRSGTCCRINDASGIPLHADDETVIHERIYLDKADRNLLCNDMTILDSVLTEPWKVRQSYRRIVSDKPMWFSHDTCGEGNNHVVVGKENYFLSADGFLMPTKKEQAPPDLRYFKK